MITLLLSLFLSVANCQPVQEPGILTISDFSGGLNTWQNSITIDPSESPSLSNVILDKTGGVTRREGFSKRNTTAIGGGSSDVNSVYQFEKSNGTKYCVAFSSTNGYYSTDGCTTFTSFISTLTRNNDVSCDPLQDRLYCVNNQFNFYFDGSTFLGTPAPASLKYIRVYRNRCFGFGAAAQPSRLYFSELGDCNAWPAANFLDVAPEDGDIGTGIGEPIFDMLPIYKKFSTWALQGATPSTWRLVSISNNTGAKNHRSIANLSFTNAKFYNDLGLGNGRNYSNKLNVQLFDSLGPQGGRPGIYMFNGIVVEEASKKLRNSIEFLDTFKANQGHLIVESKNEWDNATFDNRAMSSSRQSGFMQSSYTAVNDTIGIDFINGTLTNLSTASVPSSLTMVQTSSGSFTNAGAESNSVSINWRTNEFTVITASMYGTKAFAGTSSAFGQSGTTGQIVPTILDISSNVVLTGTTMPNPAVGADAVEYTINTYQLAQKMIMINLFFSCSGSGINSARSVPFITPGSIKIKVYHSNLNGNNNACDMGWDIDESSQTINGNSVRQYNTGISTPVWGPLAVNISSTTEGPLVFQVASATSCTGTFGSYQSQTPGVKIVAPAQSCLQVKSQFNVNSSTNTPAQIDDITASAASTGTWRQTETFISNNITSWGLFQTAQTTDGSGSIAYCLRGSTYAGGTANAGCTALTPGSAISASTASYVSITSTYTIVSGSETAKTDWLALNWNEGTQAVSATGKVFNARYHYGTQSENGTQNDRIYVLDSNGAWTIWNGVRPRFLNVINQSFMMASSSTSGSGFIYRLYDTDSDDGAAINAYWYSKDLSLSKIQNIKAIERIYTVHSPNASILDLNMLVDTGIKQKTYSINLSTGAAFGVKHTVIEPGLNGNTFRIGYSNFAPSAPWDILGFILKYRDLGLMQP